MCLGLSPTPFLALFCFFTENTNILLGSYEKLSYRDGLFGRIKSDARKGVGVIHTPLVS